MHVASLEHDWWNMYDRADLIKRQRVYANMACAHRCDVELFPVEPRNLLVIRASALAIITAAGTAAAGKAVRIAEVHDQLGVATQGLLVAVALHLHSRQVTGRSNA